MYVFTNVIGSFVVEGESIVDEVLFKTAEEYEKRDTVEKRLMKKHGIPPDEEKDTEILAHFKDSRYYAQFRHQNIALTKQAIKHSVTDDNLIIQTISTIEELDKVKNIVVKRLREWYSLYLPELSHAIDDQEQFVKNVMGNDKKALLKKVKVAHSMGADLAEADVKQILSLADRAEHTFVLRKQYEQYLEKLTEKTCPNMKAIAGALLTAKLIEHAGSLRKLAIFPASTIQILGAEKALFRHMKNKKFKPPKHGLILAHPLLSSAPRKDHGKIARTLADKLSIAAKVDYFKGDFIGDKLRNEVEERCNEIQHSR